MSGVSAIRELIEREMRADRASDDVTASLLGARRTEPCRGWVFAKETGVFCGERVILALAEWAGPRLEVTAKKCDADRLSVGDIALELRGPAGDLLAIERTLLNLLSHLCGIATATRQFADAVAPFPTRILATRKTLPGLRDLQLYAVACGGGHVHRRSLSDGVLIKENHQIFADGAELVRRARETGSPLHRVELEVQDLATVERIASDPPDIVMLDNMDLPAIERAVRLLRGKCRIEVSGGISLERVRALAELGVDFISVGKLTHSARALDLSFDFSRESR
jgi:nicotinate-nucleotide pyrophosphorylase (carboxylating)